MHRWSSLLRYLCQMATTKNDEFNYGYSYINGKRIYARILTKKKYENRTQRNHGAGACKRL